MIDLTLAEMLVKASRSFGLERIADGLLGEIRPIGTGGGSGR